jgi:fluoroacetyl-CoA thioesterase
MIEPGLTHTMHWRIEERHLASAFGSGLVAALATPALVGFCEECARRSVAPHLEKGQKTVGISVNLRHLAATPPGLEVTVRSELVAVDGRRLRFRVEANDGIDRIGEGEHERFIIDVERFAEGIEVKLRKSGQNTGSH